MSTGCCGYLFERNKKVFPTTDIMTEPGKPIQCRAAVVWEKNQPFSIENIEVAAPKNGEVRVKLTSSGICHTDSHFQEGMFPNVAFPLVLGHEGAGIIESVGEGVTKFQPGDFVVLAFESYCGECAYCKNPDCNMCIKQPRNHLQMDGISRMQCKGQALSQFFSISTFSEYTVISQWNASKVSVEVDPISSCLLGCCVPTGYGSVMNVAKVTPGSTCAIWGLGGVGMCVVMGCREAGASKIIGIDINERKFKLAKELGATDFLNPKEVTDVPGTIAQMTSRGADFCFVSVGVLSVMNEGFKSSHPHWGKTVIIGASGPEETMQAGVLDLLLGRKLFGTWYGGYKTARDLPLLADKVLKGEIQLNKLVSHRLPLDKLNEGYEMLKSGESLRAVIDFSLVL